MRRQSLGEFMFPAFMGILFLAGMLVFVFMLATSTDKPSVDKNGHKDWSSVAPRDWRPTDECSAHKGIKTPIAGDNLLIAVLCNDGTTILNPAR